MASATTTWVQQGTIFGTSGTRYNVSVSSDGVRLALDPAQKEDWNRLNISINPMSGQGTSVMAVHSSTGLIVLFNQNYKITWGETWTLNLTTLVWTNVTPANSPPERRFFGMVYDDQQDRFILFGGKNRDQRYLNDTWAYDLGNNQWTNMSPSGDITPRAYFSMAYDSSEHKVVMIGGATNNTNKVNETWIYDYVANSWTQKKNFPGMYLSQHAMAYEPGFKEMIVYGWNQGNYGETWSYSPGSDQWTNRSPVWQNMCSHGHSMAYDSRKGEIALYGGSSGIYQCSSLFFYNRTLNNWSMANPVTIPPERTLATMTYVEGLDELVIYAGYNFFGGQMNIPWVYVSNKYVPYGYYISDAKDTAGEPWYDFLNITADLPGNKSTTVQAQVRTGMTEQELNTKEFTGPDGWNNTFFTPNIDYTSIYYFMTDKYDGQPWVQYKVILMSSFSQLTPVVRKVSLEYNFPPNATILSPKGGESWSGTHKILWNATDPDGDRLSYNIWLVNLKDNISLSLAEGLNTTSFDWNISKTANAIPGTYKIWLGVIDYDGRGPRRIDFFSNQFSVVKGFNNTPPEATLVSPKDKAIVNRTTVNLTWSAYDPDGQHLSYYVHINETGGPMNTTHVNNTYYTVDNLKNGVTYHWTIVPNDGILNGTPPGLWSFTVVLNPNDRPPVISSLPVLEAVVGQLYQYHVVAMDPDLADTLTYSLPTRPSGMTIGPTTGVIDWTPVAGQEGPNKVVVKVSDGNKYAFQNFTVLVTGVVVNHPPQIASEPNLTAYVGYQYIYWMNVSDPDDGDQPTFSLGTHPVGMTIGKTGIIGWLPGYDQLGKNPVIAMVSDGQLTTTQSFNVTVLVNPNDHAPRIVSSPPVKSKMSTGQDFHYQVKATDADPGDVIRFTLISGPPGMSINPTTGVIDWTPASNITGKYDVKINISDGKGGFDTQTFTLTIEKNHGSTTSVANPMVVITILIIIVATVAATAAIARSQMKRTKDRELSTSRLKNKNKTSNRKVNGKKK
jgi:hypothetical protein